MEEYTECGGRGAGVGVVGRGGHEEWAAEGKAEAEERKANESILGLE